MEILSVCEAAAAARLISTYVRTGRRGRSLNKIRRDTDDLLQMCEGYQMRLLVMDRQDTEPPSQHLSLRCNPVGDNCSSCHRRSVAWQWCTSCSHRNQRSLSVKNVTLIKIHDFFSTTSSDQVAVFSLFFFFYPAAILDAIFHYINTTLSSHRGIRQLDHVHFQSGKRERRHFQTHYDWTAVLVGGFPKSTITSWAADDSLCRVS